MYLDRLTGHKRRRSHPRGDASCAVRRLLETPGTSPPTCRDWSYPRPHLGNLGARTDVHFGDGLRDLALLPGSNCQEGRRVDNSGTPPAIGLERIRRRHTSASAGDGSRGTRRHGIAGYVLRCAPQRPIRSTAAARLRRTRRETHTPRVSYSSRFRASSSAALNASRAAVGNPATWRRIRPDESQAGRILAVQFSWCSLRGLFRGGQMSGQ
jgi:hypothetical protein